MLTTMFYYGYYKPYLVKDVDGDLSSVKSKIIVSNKSDIINNRDATFLLNKSLKNEVVKYAKDVSVSVTSIKEASKNVMKSIDDYSKSSIFSRESALNQLDYELETFANNFNMACDTFKNQNHSQNLTIFYEKLSSQITENSKRLKNLGLVIDESGHLILDKSRQNLKVDLDKELFDTIYNNSLEILTEPLAEHMSFKGLGYYYNYKYGTMVSDTFKIIESGMLLDKAV